MDSSAGGSVASIVGCLRPEEVGGCVSQTPPHPYQAAVAGCEETTINERIKEVVSVMVAAKRVDVIEGLSYVPRAQDSTRR